jgi:anaerobic glycerol-3-phosphate dehydrogenase
MSTMSTMIYHLLSHIVSVLLDVSLQAVNLCTEVSEVHQKPRSSQIFPDFLQLSPAPQLGALFSRLACARLGVPALPAPTQGIRRPSSRV